MAGTHRTSTDHVALIDELESHAPKFDFFQALRRLECASSDRPRIGSSVRLADDPIRLGQEPTLGFSPSSLSKIERGKNGRPARMLVRFMGMFGPNGPLPLHLTEYATQREIHAKDVTFRRFMDVFHHRMLSLFYRAWSSAQPAAQHDRPEDDRYSVYVGSTFGLAGDEVRNRDEMPDLAKLYYAGRLACQSKNAEGLRSMLEDFFQIPANIDEFVGKWTKIPEEFRCYLGRSKTSATLGRCATIGSHVWDCQQKFRITMGPMSWDDYQSLLPSGAGFGRLLSIVKNYIGEELMWDVNLVLSRDEIPGPTLGTGAVLGRSCWLPTQEERAEAADLVLRDVLDSPI
ncbi:MAG: type VI secretion system baseplate subunit TssG [Planctomycetales bacterium]|nr:type VI secretion system baseplate subunit TssG [Planctomycetales bacterium]